MIVTPDDTQTNTDFADLIITLPKPGLAGYLDHDYILFLAEKYNAKIHPGWGLKSESAEFFKAAEEKGVQIIGPSTKNVAEMGGKVSSIELAEKAGVPTVPKTGILNSVEEAVEFGNKVGYPIAITANGGGGGKGMRVCKSEEDVRELYDVVISEAEAAFGNPDVFAKKFINKGRHIEVQIIGDGQGDSVALLHRDCSVQRRHQKVIEIAPADSRYDELMDHAENLANAVNYQGAGTVEFFIDLDTGNYYFLEMNTRLQVEHTITEEVTGIDIIATQLDIANGVPLREIIPKRPQARGVSIQYRSIAESVTEPTQDQPARLAPRPGPREGAFFNTTGTTIYGPTRPNDVHPDFDPHVASLVVTGKDLKDAARKFTSKTRRKPFSRLQSTTSMASTRQP